MINFLHYDLIAEFKKQFYGDLITSEHLIGSQVMMKKLTYPDSGEDETANFWGYVFEKNGKKYLLSSVDEEENEIKLSDYLPLLAKGLQKVANRTDVYYMIKKPVIAKFRPIKKHTFKEMVDEFSSLKHSHPDHQKLLWFMTMAQMLDRANFRICSNPGFGKDSTVDIIGNLIGGATTVENPTLAKLEFLTHQKLLAVNEVVDVGAAEWRNIQQFLLATGAHKPEVTKHSRAVAAGVGEFLDISKFSITLMYNDIDQYGENTKFFDGVTKDAVKDRFPAFRLYGNFTEDFNEIKKVQPSKFVKAELEEYKNLIYSFTYYKENLNDYIHGYDTTGLKSGLPHRWKVNIGRLLKIIDIYCDSQEEFSKWVGLVNKSLIDYEDMLSYPSLMETLSKAKTEKEFSKIYKDLQQIATFTDRNKEIKSILSGKVQYKDQILEEIL